MKTAIYKGIPNPEAVKWGSNDDPVGLLEPGKKYVIENIEVHSWHTKIFLQEFPGKKFNSVHFNLE